MQTSTLTCPKCGAEETLEVPADRCLTAHICKACGKELTVPKESENCCVVCEYGDRKCPVANS